MRIVLLKRNQYGGFMIRERIHSIEYNDVMESIQRNYYILDESSKTINGQYYKYNNRILLSNNQQFLEAVKNDIGGELILDSAIGPFLVFDPSMVD